MMRIFSVIAFLATAYSFVAPTGVRLAKAVPQLAQTSALRAAPLESVDFLLSAVPFNRIPDAPGKTIRLLTNNG